MVELHGNNGIVDTGDIAFTFETVENPRNLRNERMEDPTLNWVDQDYHIDGFRVYPYGSSNNLPKVLNEVIQKNYIAPGILKKKAQLLWGQGPRLYTEKYNEDGSITRQWVKDDEVQAWLDSWDAEGYMLAMDVDYQHLEGGFTKMYQQKGSRINKPWIAKLEHVNAEDARLASPQINPSRKATHCIVTDWRFKKIENLLNYKSYPLFDFKNPFEHELSVMYSNMYSFCSEYYTVPDIYGSLEWLRRSTAIPLILKALSKNSINLKYHVISPDKFWNDMRDKLVEQATKRGVVYEESELITYKKNFLKRVADVLSGADNTGKFWHSVKYTEIDGNKIFEHGWEIKEIKQNIKDFVSSQIEISKHAAYATSVGLQVHTAIGNVANESNSDSGSEQIYAFKNYLATGVNIPEMIVLKPINYALAANFPAKKLKIGFYHDQPKKEEDVSPADRIKNN